MPADGYLRRVLADGALPFRYRGSVRALLGEPDGAGLLQTTPPALQPQFSYPRSAWPDEIELPDGIAAMARVPQDRPTGNDRPRGQRDRGTAAGDMSSGTPDEHPEQAADHPPAVPRPAAGTERGPQPQVATRPSAVTDVSPAAVPGRAPVTPPGSARAAQPLIAEPARHAATEPAQTPVAGSARPPGPQAGSRTDARPGLDRSATAPAQQGPKLTTSEGGSQELLIPGRTARSALMTRSAEVGARPDPSGLTRHGSKDQPGGPPRRSGAEPAGITGRQPGMTDSSSDLSTPDPGLTIRRIPPRHMRATAGKHDGGTVIPGGEATPFRVLRPAGPGRQADIVPAGTADTPPPRRPAREAGIRGRVEQSAATPPVSAPQLIVMLPPRTPTGPPAFWERRHLGRLWSRPLR